MTNISTILDGFKTKKLSYHDYLGLALVNDTLTAYIAYTRFKDNPNLTSDDITNFIEKTHKAPTKYLSTISMLSGTEPSAQQESDLAKAYCGSHPSDTACICLNNTIAQIAFAEKENAENNAKMAAWKAEDDKNQQDYDNRLATYNEQYRQLKNFLDTFSVSKIVGWAQEPDSSTYPPDTYDIVRSYYDGWGASYRSKWTFTYKQSYKDAKLNAFKQENYPDPATRVRTEQPNLVTHDLVTQCCANVINPGLSSIDNVMQSCNQKIINITAADAAAKKKADDDAAAAAKKKADDDAAAAVAKKKAIDDAAAAATKKKHTFIIAIVAFIILFLFLLGAASLYYYYYYLDQNNTTPSSSVSSTPS
jgi:hypothetical protein